MISTASRSDSPARWTAAFDRAATEGVRVMQLPTSGVWIATSGTDAATAYVVTVDGCECYAGAHGDPCCKHRAALRVRLGLMAGGDCPESDPTPPILAAIVPAHRMCTDCLDTGWARM